MKKRMKQKVAYALALALGAASVWGGGTAFSLPEMGIVHAASSVTVSTVEELKTAIEGSDDTIVLMKDIEDTNGKISSLARTVTIDLNGHTLTGNDSNSFHIKSSGKLTLTGGGTVKGTIMCFWVASGGELILDNVTVNSSSPGDAAVHLQGGKVTMNSGATVNGNPCSGVFLDGGTFIMNGGTITGNKPKYDGGGIDIYNNGTVTMNGGTITGCKAKNGGGVVVEQGTFTIKGGSITGNTASEKGGGVYVYSGATFNNNGGTISGNTASGDSTTNNIGYQTSSSTTKSSSSSTRSSSSSSSSDDDDSDSKSFSDGGTKTKGSGSSKADYKKSSSTSVKYVASAVSYSAKTATVPATVKVGGKTYNVTAISAEAFSGYDNIQTLTIGKNIKKIGKSAFDGCKKLKTLTVNSRNLTAKNIKGAFKGASIKTVYVPANKVAAYKKILTKKVTGNKNKITVKAKKK